MRVQTNELRQEFLILGMWPHRRWQFMYAPMWGTHVQGLAPAGLWTEPADPTVRSTFAIFSPPLVGSVSR